MPNITPRVGSPTPNNAPAQNGTPAAKPGDAKAADAKATTTPTPAQSPNATTAVPGDAKAPEAKPDTAAAAAKAPEAKAPETKTPDPKAADTAARAGLPAEPADGRLLAGRPLANIAAKVAERRQTNSILSNAGVGPKVTPASSTSSSGSGGGAAGAAAARGPGSAGGGGGTSGGKEAAAQRDYDAALLGGNGAGDIADAQAQIQEDTKNYRASLLGLSAGTSNSVIEAVEKKQVTVEQVQG